MEKNKIILEIRAGTGGDEAGLFVKDLYKTYFKYSQNKNWEVDILEVNLNKLGGFNKIVFGIQGKGVLERFRNEGGVHRVQRVPKTDKNKRVHTSTVSVAIFPEVDEFTVDIKPSDVRVDTFRASGNGGQKVNKTSSAVRVVHRPTGITVICQDERSQTRNKERAMSVLRARIFDLEEKSNNMKVVEMRRSQIGNADRSEKIRTYNYPQDRITDHRTDITLNNINSIMNGNLDSLLSSGESK